MNRCDQISIFHKLNQIILRIIIIAHTCVLFRVEAACYFSSDLQGTYVTQSLISHGNEVQYSEVNVTEDSIPIWGLCYRRVDNNIILQIGSDETACFRCFHLKLVARNILRVHTADLNYISKCYTNELKAIASCPTAEILKDRTRHTEIILYKTIQFDGQDIHREYCPINGRYSFTYNIDDGNEDRVECSGNYSELDNCPSGSAINLRFRKCSFENHEVTLECLGHWQGLESNKYLALMNARGEDKLGPSYRCAIYSESQSNGEIKIFFSNDSTCSSIIHDKGMTEAHSEILTLYPIRETDAPDHSNYCHLPNWMHGQWEHLQINTRNIIYKDHSSFKTYTMKCIQGVYDESSTLEAGKYKVFSRTQCGEEQYHCIWVVKRSQNILEFQVGDRTVHDYASAMSTHNDICDDRHFNDTRWLAQARLDHNVSKTPCPISGELTGMLPDAERLCAKLSSECESPDIMHYQVSVCDYDDVIEEREYKCFGQWMENGFIYTYTQRVDVGTYECFVGALHTDNRIFIKEAGEHCQRNINPNKFGMELQKTKFCDVSRAKYDSALRESNMLDKNIILNFPHSEIELNSTNSNSISNVNSNPNHDNSTEFQYANDLSDPHTDAYDNSLNDSLHLKNAISSTPASNIKNNRKSTHATNMQNIDTHNMDDPRSTYTLNNSFMLRICPLYYIFNSIIIIFITTNLL